MFPFDIPENIKQPKVFCFQGWGGWGGGGGGGVSIGNISKKGLKTLQRTT